MSKVVIRLKINENSFIEGGSNNGDFKPMAKFPLIRVEK